MPLSGADWAAAEGTTPGSANAESRSAPPRFSWGRSTLITSTAASADAVAAGGSFLAGVDVLLRLGVESVVVELHLRPREVALLPRLGWFHARASGERASNQG